MKVIELSEAKARLEFYAEACQESRVIVTIKRSYSKSSWC